MMTHEEAQELLAVYALNAVDGEERRELERHIDECVRCSTELDALRQVATAMGNVGEPASSELWERISARLYDDAAGSVPPIRVLDLAGATGPVRDVRAPSSRRPRFVVAAVSLAAAVLIGVLSVSLVNANQHVSQLNSALSAATSADSRALVTSALRTPGHLNVSLTDSHSESLARFVLVNGHGYLVTSNMSRLPSDQTYQLWGVIDGKTISIGLLGPNPQVAAFTVSGSRTPTALAVTIEPAGGSVTPTTPIVAAGTITA
jgi:anti-sigma-K factor RskA